MLRAALLSSLLCFLLAPQALAARPDAGGGLHPYDPTDILEFLDSANGLVRVHYSVSGPNVTRLDDLDNNGLPDFPELVAQSSELVFDTLAALGLRLPVTESELGLGPLGGSDAFDAYLVDFAGQADGMYSSDACGGSPQHCAGFLTMENDFSGYGYSNLASAVATLTSHELFHAVQAAYLPDLDVWLSEGSAVWFEWAFDDLSEDFRWFADAYLEDAGRSLDRPPSGPVPTFAYATGLYWVFLDLRLGMAPLDALFSALEAGNNDPIAALDQALVDAGTDLATEWLEFATWNLATGRQAGLLQSYPFAEDLGGIVEEAAGKTLEDTNRFYPLATTYYRLNHPGGPLVFATDVDATGLVFRLFPAADRLSPVEDPIWEYWPGASSAEIVSDALPKGTYWLMGTYPQQASSSVHTTICLGASSEPCAPMPERPPDEKTGCDCQASILANTRPTPVGLVALILLALGTTRRRR